MGTVGTFVRDPGLVRLPCAVSILRGQLVSFTPGTAGADGDGISSYFSPRLRNYGPLAFNRTQTMSINYLYELPQLGRLLRWRPAGWVLDSWQLSGITLFQTGSPFTPGFTTTDGADLTGSTDGARIQVVGNPYDNVPAGLYFKPAAFARPAKGSFGNAGVNVLYGPGTANWDLSMTKRFRFGEAKSISLRGEASGHPNFPRQQASTHRANLTV